MCEREREGEMSSYTWRTSQTHPCTLSVRHYYPVYPTRSITREDIVAKVISGKQQAQYHSSLKLERKVAIWSVTLLNKFEHFCNKLTNSHSMYHNSSDFTCTKCMRLSRQADTLHAIYLQGLCKYYFCRL